MLLYCRWLGLGQDGDKKTYAFTQMKKETAKFANVLKTLGVEKGERVFTLFSQFGPEPILQRMKRGDAKVLFTTKKLYEKKIIPILNELPGLRWIMIANFLSQTIRPGSMGRPIPGIVAGIVRQNDDGTLSEVTEPNKEGDLAYKRAGVSREPGLKKSHGVLQTNAPD